METHFLMVRRDLLGLCAGLFALAAFTHSAPALAADKVPVVTSFSILGDLVREVGGDRVSVNPLVGPDQDAHVFEPRPADAKRLLNAKLLVLNGFGFEPWADRLAKSAGFQGATVVVTDSLKPRTMPGEGGEPKQVNDPHAWQDPTNVMVYVQRIAEALGQVDPAGAASYQGRAVRYVKDLQKLDADIKKDIAAIPPAKRKVITSHDAFAYFGAHYGVEFLAPQGVSTEAEPSPKHVGELVRQMKREKIRALFLENMSNSNLLTQLAKDANAVIGGTLYADALSSPSAPASTYLKMMELNARTLVTGMKLN
jgi:zinc/manganese transport system substrate-binding protein